jgi:transposase
VQASRDMVPFRLKMWLDRVFQLAQGLTTYAASTVRQKRRDIEATLADLLATRPTCEIAETVRAKMARASPRLLTFLDHPGPHHRGEIKITNSACERALRPAVIQRKVTNGFRSMWAAQGDCTVRTVVDTEKLGGKSPFQTIFETLV